ncbi:hypothetical protein GH714_037540 [Hevea brasiliensis]|uniref:RNA helicase n=1 Tax=Hevea brasiliensis TaxID=3981 RepID=A0A6A6MMS9_HEVBR|nr:hypothetical protein GH714_037540 [Hevea brasiliensis]
MEPIICTQPRRFAVVAVAKMVAQARNCELGGEVGYHIGHSKLFSARSKIVFKTAGVLLEEMKEKGLNALKYKVIILDEVHERSIESDLALVCVKQFLLKNNDLSVDTEQALMAMKIWKSHRKVILATNIAESSVTIPKVAYVIDSCRSLQVFWDFTRKMDSAELIWVSKSQADQRKGRTGRTCDGQIYRLVTGSFFSSFRNTSLQLYSALLQKVLDPPHPQVVEEALNLLVHIKAPRISTRGRYEPSFYGRLLASFSLSFDASVLILKFGDIGLLREGILMGILMDAQPLPILHPFGEEHLFTEYTFRYFGGDCNNIVKLGQRRWISTVLNTLNDFLDEDVLNSLHRFRPRFLAKCDGLPTYYDPYEFGHVCLLKSQRNGDRVVAADDETNHLMKRKNVVLYHLLLLDTFRLLMWLKNCQSLSKRWKSWVETASFSLESPFHLMKQALGSYQMLSQLEANVGIKAYLQASTAFTVLSQKAPIDRATSLPIDSIDISKLSIIDDDRPIGVGTSLISKRGTDSSGEIFGNGDANWASDVSEAKNSSRREMEREREEKENLGIGVGFGQFGNFDAQGNESGYGNEPGYRGDAEFGYEDELDEEEEDARLLFWGDQFGEGTSLA